MMKTMPIQIERIRVNRGGPLKKDFELESGDVNLVYGLNETGKSFVVEAIINILFRTKGSATAGWELRNWRPDGSIIVSGLDDKPVAFRETGKKLEDYWGQETVLPQDLSRMLVVKEGETLLTEEKDGVGRDILKNYLSGIGLLDAIAKRISPTLQGAEVKGKDISGKQIGEIKQRNALEKSRVKLTELFKEVEDVYTSGIIYDLQRQQTNKQSEIDGLEKAKRYHAYCLQAEKDSLTQEKAALPGEKELSDIEATIAVYEGKQEDFKRKSTDLANLKSAVDNFHWAESALKDYEKILDGQGAQPRLIYAVLALCLFAGVLVSGFLNYPIPLAICAAGTLVFSVLYTSVMRRSLVLAGINQELEKLKDEFQKRFGTRLTDKAVLQAKVKDLERINAQYEVLERDLNKLEADLRMQEHNIRENLRRFTGKALPPADWRAAVDDLRSELKTLTDRINSLDKELATLNVPVAELLSQDPGIKWDAELYEESNKELSDISDNLNEELSRLDTLKARVAQATDSPSTDWEELITALRDKREEVAQEYRDLTTEILAKIQVYSVIQELRKTENARIADGLKQKELTEPLHAITNCYKCMRYDVDNGLIAVTDKDEEYPLETLSTGAKEQAFLAMRMGFASIAMKGRTAFLILDDAFQHSDRPRRENLMNQITRLVDSKWQIFYFTMDDHIKNLFMEAGEKLGDRFKSLELR